MRESVKGSDANEATVTFVDGLALPPPPRTRRGGAGSPAPNFDNKGEQALVVGSNIVAFAKGVAPDIREAIVNCSLIAQLAGNRQVPDREDVRAWYACYFEVLSNIGWVIQDRGFSEHHESGAQFEANKAILSVASVLLGPASTAFTLVESTLKAMGAMSQGPWMTIFRRESQAAKAAKFQVSTVEKGAAGIVRLQLMAFELDASSALTQVLFFKLRTMDVTLRHASGGVVIDDSRLLAIAPRVGERVAAYQSAFIDALQI